MRQKITRKLLASLRPKNRRYYVLEPAGSGTVGGFGVRVGPRHVIYGVRAGAGGRWFPIGRADLIPLEEARQQARELLLELAKPGAAADLAGRNATFRELWDRFRSHRGERWSVQTRSIYAGLWRNHIFPAFGDRRINSLRPAEIEDFLQGLTTFTRNRVRQQLAAAYRYAEQIRWIDRSPVTALADPRELPRRRRAETAELRAVATALSTMEREGDLSPEAAILFWIVLRTGCRPGEVLGARREQADLDSDRPQIRWAEGFKRKGEQRVIFLPRDLARRLKAVGRPENPWLVPGQASGRPYKAYRAAWRRVIERASVADLQLRDLRRSWRSEAETLMIPLAHVQAHLGHRPGSRVTDGTYQSTREEEAAAAAALVDEHILGLLGKPATPGS